MAYIDKKMYRKAAATLDQAVKIESTANVHFNRGIARGFMGDIDGSINDFETVIKLDPTFIDAYINLSKGNSLKGDYIKALKILEKALEINTDSRKEEDIRLRIKSLKKIKIIS